MKNWISNYKALHRESAWSMESANNTVALEKEGEQNSVGITFWNVVEAFYF